MNRTLAVLALPLLAAGVLSCGRGGDGGATGEPVRFWHAMGGALGKPLEKLVAEYNVGRAVPVESVSMGQYEALSQKLMAAVAAGGPPDIGQCYESWTANLVENGSIAQLSALVEGPNGLPAESVADIYGIFLEGARHGGVLWSFPFNKSVRCLYYNRDMFREAGLDPDAPPRTWEDYRSIAKKLTADRDGDGATDRWGLASQITVTMFENLIVQAGGSLLDEAETQVAFDSPEGVEALEFMADLLVRDGSTLLTQGFEYQNDFLAGKVGMIEGSSVSLAFFQDVEGRPKYAFDLGIAALPTGRRDAQLVAGTDVVIFRSSPEREAQAWDFVRWFTSTEQTARWSAETGYLPVRRSAMSHPLLASKLDEHRGLREAYAQIERALPQPKAKGWYAGRQILEREAIEPVLRGRLEPREALRIAAERANDAL